MTKMVFKHSFSGAADVLLEWEIDYESKTIEVTSQTAGSRQPFLSSNGLQYLAHHLAQEGIVIYNDDDVNSWTPQRTSWTVFVTAGDLRFRLICWNHRKDVSGSEIPMTIELYPELPEASAS